ncbi:DUF3416 domain-containing protein, partial [Streptomyces sp. SID7958]
MPAKHHSSSPPTSGTGARARRAPASPSARSADPGPPSAQQPPGPVSPSAAGADTPAGHAAAVGPATSVGRIPVLDVRPQVRCGLRPAKAVTGETFQVSATVFREGHDAVAANVVLKDPEGRPG